MENEGMITGPDNGVLVIPLEKKKLGSFLASLLGQSQTIDRKRFGTFDINIEWIRGLVDSIHLHITRQINAKRIFFSAEINYSDSEIRHVNSYEELINYNEVFSRHTIKLKIMFSYLIELPGKENPEREDFEFCFDQYPSEQERSESMFSSFMQRDVGYISYRIYYTERTWGDAIDKLISEFITKAFKKELKGKSILKLLFSLASIFISVMCMYSPIVIQQVASIKSKNKLIEELTKSPNVSYESKVDSIYKLSMFKEPLDGLSAQNMILGLFAGILIMFITMYLSKKGQPSFIVLTKSDEQNREKALSKVSFKRFCAILAYIASIVAGVLSNYIFLFVHK